MKKEEEKEWREWGAVEEYGSLKKGLDGVRRGLFEGIEGILQ